MVSKSHLQQSIHSFQKSRCTSLVALLLPLFPSLTASALTLLATSLPERLAPPEHSIMTNCLCRETTQLAPDNGVAGLRLRLVLTGEGSVRDNTLALPGPKAPHDPASGIGGT